MRLPTRKSEILRSTKKVTDVFLSAAAVQRYKDELQDLIKNQRPPAVKEVQRTAEMGDFSENAAYQMAKGRLRQINSHVTSLEEKIKNAVVIKPSASGRVSLGSTVTLAIDGKKTTYQILGAQEADPKRGRISYLSPLGAALVEHKEGGEVEVNKVKYRIISISN